MPAQPAATPPPTAPTHATAAPTHTSATHTSASPAQLLFDVLEFAVGLGVFVMTLSPLALPGIVLVLVPLMVLGAVGAIVSAAVALPVLLVVRIAQTIRAHARERIRPATALPGRRSSVRSRVL